MSQKLFDDAVKYYNATISAINVMSEAVQKAMPQFTPEVARCQFDIILQYTLLKVAVADGKFEPVEGEFIDKITDSFDIIRLFEDVPAGMNWQWLANNAPISDIAKIIDQAGELAKQHMEAFAQVFAVLDACSEKVDELSLVCEGLMMIAACFSFLDGKGADSEASALADVITENVMTPWQQMLQRAKANK